MSTTIDHLRIDHRVTILQEFTDSKGLVMRRGEGGILRELAFDQKNLIIQMSIECETGTVTLCFALRAAGGPRNGYMRDYFELGEYVSNNLTLEAANGGREQQYVVPVKPTVPFNHERVTSNDEDRLPDVEQEILDRYDHIGAAASVAEMYAQRMRTFRAVGNEPRAVAAFKLAIQWMATYAGWATSGGEGAALSYERDKFHTQLVSEFGYDPTEAQ